MGLGSAMARGSGCGLGLSAVSGGWGRGLGQGLRSEAPAHHRFGIVQVVKGKDFKNPIQASERQAPTLLSMYPPRCAFGNLPYNLHVCPTAT